ncbi:MAG: flavoprotein [Planctomycetota bacterium]
MGRDSQPSPAVNPPQGGGFAGRTITLGVTGGVAAYKTVGLASLWTQRGARVRVLMTPAATRFVTPLTFQSVTRQPVLTDIWHAIDTRDQRPDHIEGEEAAVFVVAPATADFLARAAHGFANDIVCLSLLAFVGPVVIAPAMNDRMWANVAVQENVETLARRGVEIVPPGHGHLACGAVGAGRLAPEVDIDRRVSLQLGEAPPPRPASD